MDDPVLQFVTRAVFVLVFCLTLGDFVQWRDLARLEIAALFGGLACFIVEQAIGEVTRVPDWLMTIAVLALLTQPYLLLRVLLQFRRIPHYQHWIGAACLAVSCII